MRVCKSDFGKVIYFYSIISCFHHLLSREDSVFPTIGGVRVKSANEQSEMRATYHCSDYLAPAPLPALLGGTRPFCAAFAYG